MPRSRRALLRESGLALGAGTLASVAGCTSIPATGGDGDGGGGANPSPPPTPTADPDRAVMADVARWLPTPETTPLRDGYGVRYFDLAAIRERQDAMHENAYARLERQMQYPVPGRVVDPADVDAAVGLDGDGAVAIGSFDPEAVGERITDDGDGSSAGTPARTPTTPTRTPWSEPESYRGYELYGDRSAYAVSEAVVIYASPMGRDGDARAHAKAIIDAGADGDEATHYHDANAYVAAMLGTVEDPHALWCYPEAMDGSTTRGFRKDVITGGLKAWQFGAETTHLTFANTYPDAEAAANADLAGYIEAESDRFGPYEGLDVRTEGRLVWTDGDIPTDEFDHLSAGGPDDGVTTPN